MLGGDGRSGYRPWRDHFVGAATTKTRTAKRAPTPPIQAYERRRCEKSTSGATPLASARWHQSWSCLRICSLDSLELAQRAPKLSRMAIAVASAREFLSASESLARSAPATA